MINYLMALGFRRETLELLSEENLAKLAREKGMAAE